MTKFKVGDRVRLKQEFRDCSYSRDLKSGKGFPIAQLSDSAGTASVDDCWVLRERLELAPTIDPAKKYQTRNQAWEVIEFITTKAPGDKSLVVAVRNVATGAIQTWVMFGDGRSPCATACDLIEVPPAPKEYERWIVCDPNYGFATQKQAQAVATRPGDAVIKIKFREGEGL